MLKLENPKKVELNHNICLNRYICIGIKLSMWDIISKRYLTFVGSRKDVSVVQCLLVCLLDKDSF